MKTEAEEDSWWVTVASTGTATFARSPVSGACGAASPQRICCWNGVVKRKALPGPSQPRSSRPPCSPPWGPPDKRFLGNTGKGSVRDAAWGPGRGTGPTSCHCHPHALCPRLASLPPGQLGSPSPVPVAGDPAAGQLDSLCPTVLSCFRKCFTRPLCAAGPVSSHWSLSTSLSVPAPSAPSQRAARTPQKEGVCVSPAVPA